MPMLDEHGRLTGRFKSLDHYIDCHVRLCKKCNGEMLPYELDKDGVCVYCRVAYNTGDLLPEDPFDDAEDGMETRIILDE